MDSDEEKAVVRLSKPVAVIACASMALLYVIILYSPTRILRLPNPASFKQFLIRRFVCAAVSSVLSLLACSLILSPIQGWKLLTLLNAFGIRVDHMWQALVFPLLLTSLMYIGSFLFKSLSMLDSWIETREEDNSPYCISYALVNIRDGLTSMLYSITAWRNCVVAPLTEELVFRACMIPLLLCGGFKPQSVVFLCPLFFSLAHLNHLWEFYTQKNCSLARASVVVGMQLGYTMVFGSFASFLFIRTGHLMAPIAAHVFCNFMGLPALYSQRKGWLVLLAFMAGTIGFLWLLFPATNPDMYNDRVGSCNCWLGYCRWNS